MSVKLLTKHHLEFLSLKRGCAGSFESPCWKSHVAAQIHLSTTPLALAAVRSKVVIVSVAHCLSLFPLYGGFCVWSLLCNVSLCVLFSFAIILLRKRELLCFSMYMQL